MRSKHSELQAKAEDTTLFDLPLDDIMARTSESGVIPKFVEHALNDIESNRMYCSEGIPVGRGDLTIVFLCCDGRQTLSLLVCSVSRPRSRCSLRPRRRSTRVRVRSPLQGLSGLYILYLIVPHVLGNHFVNFASYRDPHISGALLKEFLRSLPTPLITFEAYEQLVVANGRSLSGARVAPLFEISKADKQRSHDGATALDALALRLS